MKKYRMKNGYIALYLPQHPRAMANGQVYEHLLVAESALGALLPPGAVVHHINENKTDNRGANLVICQDEIYHRLLHRRMKGYKATGNPNARTCWICKQWVLPTDPDVCVRRVGKRQWETTHQGACDRRYQAAYRLKNASHGLTTEENV